MLLLRAQSREKSGSAIAAAKDYLALYYGFPLSDEARAAGQHIPELSRQLGDAFPAVSLAQQQARGEALFGAHRWREAHQEFEAELPQAGGADHDHAELRIAQCKSSQGGGASALTSPKFADLTQKPSGSTHFRKRIAMKSTKRKCSMRSPKLRIDFRKISGPLKVIRSRKLLLGFAGSSARRGLLPPCCYAAPNGKEAPIAAWRFAWAAYMDRKPETVSLLEAFIRKYPTYNAVPDALYWLGRSAERAGNLPRARSFYVKASQRFPQTFFGLRAADKVAALGSQPLDPADILVAVPDAPPIIAVGRPSSPRKSTALASRHRVALDWI